ncbi:hypothetical protein D3C72_1258090 [compost metagenome]
MRRGDTGNQIETVDAQKQFVETVLAQLLLGSRTVERVRITAHAAAQHHHLHPIITGKLIGNVQRIGHHHQIASSFQERHYLGGGGTGIEDQRIAITHIACRYACDLRLHIAVQPSFVMQWTIEGKLLIEHCAAIGP